MTNIFDQREVFDVQFEPDGDGFLYRKNTKGAPIRVSASERDRYINTFDRSLKYQKWTIGISTTALIIAIVTYETLTKKDLSDVYLYAGLGFILSIFLLIQFRIRNLPARELRNRATVGSPLSKTEIRERHAANVNYGQIAGIVLIGFVFPAISVRKYGIESVWSILALAYCSFILVSAALLIFRKMRLRSKHNSV